MNITHTSDKKTHVISHDEDSSLVFKTLNTLRFDYKIPSECKFTSSVKSQLNYAKRRKATSLIWLENGQFIYQDLHEYPEWMKKELGTINFEKRPYENIQDLIEENLYDQ
jgi:hypothetical protein